MPLNISQLVEILHPFQTLWVGHIQPDSLRTLKKRLNQFTWFLFLLRCSAWFIWGRETVLSAIFLQLGFLGEQKMLPFYVFQQSIFGEHLIMACSRRHRERGRLRTSLLLYLQAIRVLSRTVLSGNWILQAFISPYFERFHIIWTVSLNSSALVLVPCPWLDCI